MEEADTTLGQPASQQTVRCERAVAAFCPVHVEDALRFARDVHQFGDRRLHLESQFVLSDTSLDFWILVVFSTDAVHRFDRIDHLALLPQVNASGAVDVQHRITVRTELHPLKATGEEAAVPLSRRDRLRLATAHRRQDDVAWEVVRIGSKSVLQPRSHRRSTGNTAAGVHQRVCRIVINLFGVQRSDDADVVGD